MSQLEVLIEQTEFLLEKHKEAKDDCTKIFSDLLNVVENRMERTNQEEKEYEVLDRVHDLLSGQVQHATTETQDEIEFLTAQLQAFKELKASDDSMKRDETVKMLLEGVEELEDTVTFKKGILEESAVARQNLVTIANDIKEALEEGSAEEVELYLKAILDGHEEEGESDDCDDCQDDCGGCAGQEELSSDKTECCGGAKTSCCSSKKSCCSEGIDLFSHVEETSKKN